MSWCDLERPDASFISWVKETYTNNTQIFIYTHVYEYDVEDKLLNIKEVLRIDSAALLYDALRACCLLKLLEEQLK